MLFRQTSVFGMPFSRLDQELKSWDEMGQFLVQVHRKFVVEDSQEPEPAFFLRLHKHLPARPTAGQTLDLPFGAVIAASEKFDSHFFLPAFDLPTIGDSHHQPSCLPMVGTLVGWYCTFLAHSALL